MAVGKSKVRGTAEATEPEKAKKAWQEKERLASPYLTRLASGKSSNQALRQSGYPVRDAEIPVI